MPLKKRVVIAPLLSGAGPYRTLWQAKAIGGCEILDMPESHKISDNPFGALDGNFPDVVVTQVPVSVSMLAAVKWLKNNGVRVVIDIDDDTELINPQANHYYEQHPGHSELNNFQIEKLIVKEADLVTVTTKRLQDKFGGVIIPNHVPGWYFDIDGGRQWGVGWTGNVSIRPGDLAVMRGALRTFPIRWIGAGTPNMPEDIRADMLAHFKREMDITDIAETVGWQHIEGDYQRAMANFKVGIVPMIDNAFNNAKSALKGLEFAALGVPFVATPTQPYRELGAGLMARKPKNWRGSVMSLLNNTDLWHTERARNEGIARRYIIEENLDRWIEAWTGDKADKAIL